MGPGRRCSTCSGAASCLEAKAAATTIAQRVASQSARMVRLLQEQCLGHPGLREQGLGGSLRRLGLLQVPALGLGCSRGSSRA